MNIIFYYVYQFFFQYIILPSVKSRKIHQFETFSEPKNTTEEEQEAFYSKSYDDFQIPDNIDDFNKSIYWKNNSTLMSSIFKVLIY
ncbi:kinase-like domain-containing protein [Rhizophagus irregularis DAOM 181602=DAOM 197198]|nr:kinase-like domain-containing protein [Rhizophagus irregularis DAOM 181602=DAOM 197198]